MKEGANHGVNHAEELTSCGVKEGVNHAKGILHVIPWFTCHVFASAMSKA